MTGETFVEAATYVCMSALELDVRTAVLLHRASGPVALAVDNYLGATDPMRRWMLTEEAWYVNPVMIELRRQLAVLGPEFTDVHVLNELARDRGYVGTDLQPVAIPLLGPAGWFGTIVVGSNAAPGVEDERRLVMLGTELSVWCTAHGVSTLPDVRPLARRQHEIAVLAAQGRTNTEIAGELGISINTVKLRLKQVFERLGVDNRTELTNVLRRLAPLEDVPPGVTHRGGIAITAMRRDAPSVPIRVLDTSSPIRES